MVKTNKASLLQRISLSGALALGSLGLGGCYTPNDYSRPSQPSFQTKKPGKGIAGEFFDTILGVKEEPVYIPENIIDIRKPFLYNHRIDNGDGKFDFDDKFEGLGKSYFYSGEEVNATKLIWRDKDCFVTAKLFDPARKEIYGFSLAISAGSGREITIRQNCRDLLEKNGPGEYEVEWHVNGQREDMIKFLVLDK